MKLYRYLLLLLLLTSYINADTIAQQWERSPQHKEYLQAMEAGDLQRAMKIQRASVNAITEVLLQEYLADFKAKYRAKYLAIFQAYPLALRDITAQTHKQLRPHLIDSSIKGRNAFAKAIYTFIEHYNREDGKATKYAKKLFVKVKGSQGTPLEKLLLDMAKESDSEAAKTPEQKKREYEEFIRRENEKQARENEKQARENEKQAEIKKEIDASQRNIDANKREIAKWDELIERLKGLGE